MASQLVFKSLPTPRLDNGVQFLGTQKNSLIIEKHIDNKHWKTNDKKFPPGWTTATEQNQHATTFKKVKVEGEPEVRKWPWIWTRLHLGHSYKLVPDHFQLPINGLVNKSIKAIKRGWCHGMSWSQEKSRKSSLMKIWWLDLIVWLCFKEDLIVFQSFKDFQSVFGILKPFSGPSNEGRWPWHPYIFPCSLEFLLLGLWGTCFDWGMFGEVSRTLRLGPTIMTGHQSLRHLRTCPV